MTTLAATITATQRTITLSGDVSAATPSRLYVIEDEIVELERFGFVPPSSTYPDGTNRSVWFVKRGHDGSTAATHASGTTVYAAIGGYNRSASLANASPVVSGGGGSSVTVDNGVDAPAAVTGIVAKGRLDFVGRAGQRPRRSACLRLWRAGR